jgi:hypothetical protein
MVLVAIIPDTPEYDSFVVCLFIFCLAITLLSFTITFFAYIYYKIIEKKKKKTEEGIRKDNHEIERSNTKT